MPSPIANTAASSSHNVHFSSFITTQIAAATTMVPQATTSHCGYSAKESSIGAVGVFVSNASSTPRGSTAPPPAPSKMICPAPPRPPCSPLVQSKPQLLAWLTCDGVHIDPSSGKHTILGIFSNVQARQFPVTHPFMIWFLTISDVSPGKHSLKISMGLEGTTPQQLLERPFESQSPLHRINLINEIRNLSFPGPGEFELLVEIDDELLLATSLSVSG